MTRYSFSMVLTLAVVLSVPTLGAALADGDGHGHDGNPGQVDNHGKNGGDGDHGNNNQNNNNQTTNPPKAGDNDNKNNQDDHGSNQQENENKANQQNPQRLQANLAATPSGTAIDASGSVDIRAQGQQQRLKVQVQANVPDGTMFKVLANGMQVGTLTIRFNEAELELDTEEGAALPGGLMPGSITMIVVTDMNGAIVLQAQFGAVAPGTGQPGQPAPQRETVALVSAPAGMALAANGQVSRRVDGDRQRLEVEVEAHVLDGTVFKVLADGVPIGTLTFRLQEAEFELESENAGMPPGLVSIGAIKTVSVTDSSGNTVLSASL